MASGNYIPAAGTGYAVIATGRGALESNGQRVFANSKVRATDIVVVSQLSSGFAGNVFGFCGSGSVRVGSSAGASDADKIITFQVVR